MGRSKKKKKNKRSDELRADIRDIFANNPNKQLNYKQIASLLEVHDPQIRKLIYTLLNELAGEGALHETQKGKFKSSGKISKNIVGILDTSRRGSGYVIVDGMDEDIFIPERAMGKALNGDTVGVAITKKKGRKQEGKIVEIIDRKVRLIVGTLEVQDHYSFLVPDDPKLTVDLFISGSSLKGGKDGFKAIAKITDWPDSAKNPFGEIVEILGNPESNDAEMKSILALNDIPFSFPEQVLGEANKIDIQLSPKEIKNRRDMREVTTLTIDPFDAKDFDDAISVEFLENNILRIGIHIADVGHYVKEGSALDKEAHERGNSVYLVDRVIPMLPEHLSNGVCSLRPNEEKFAFSAVFDLTIEGKISKQWFGKTVINSNRRFTYEEAQEVIETGKGDLSKEILTLDKIAKNLREARMQHGGLEIGASEIRFVLNDEGHPEEVVKKMQKDANKLVEEFMLLTNRKVGEYVGDVKNPQRKPAELIYRVHDKPDMAKVEQFAVFVSKFGKEFKFKNDRDIAKKMNQLFAEMKGEPEFNMVQSMAIKSMAKAVYDTENIGHYGLGFDYYAHFTSPIRRYADLTVHRVLFNELQKQRKQIAGLKDTADHISQTERRAVDAERASGKYFQARYLEDKEGEVFNGFITGLTEWGIYVELEENYCEGMISLKALAGDRYVFDEKDYLIYGTKTGQEFNLGDHLKVKISSVSIAKRQIDLELLDD